MRRFGYPWRALAAGALLVGLAVVPSAGALAATDSVSTCDESDLRTVISSAAAGDTVTFNCSGTITLGSTVTLDKNRTIDGSGVSVTLNDLTIANGGGANSGGRVDGGGINNLGTLSVTNSTFNGNFALAGGAGIKNQGILEVANSTFSGNLALTGGGIVNQGTLTVTNSTVSGNRANSTVGGIATFGTGAKATLVNTIVANSGGGDCSGHDHRQRRQPRRRWQLPLQPEQQ